MNDMLTWLAQLGQQAPAQLGGLLCMALVYLGGMSAVAGTARRAWKDRPDDLSGPVRARFLAGAIASTLFWPYVGGQVVTASFSALGPGE